MLETIGKFFSWLKLNPSIVFVITVFSAAILYLPASVLEPLGFVNLRETYRPYIVILFIGSLTILLAYLLGWTGLKGYQWVSKFHWRKKIKQKLTELSPEQKRILNEFISNNTRSAILDYSDGEVLELLNNRIISIPTRTPLWYSRESASDFDTAVNLSPWVYQYLKQHPNVLKEDS